MQPESQIFWNRLDLHGKDACRLYVEADHSVLSGLACFVEAGAQTSLGYRIHCDSNWATTSVRVRGRIGTEPIRWDFRREANGVWYRNHMPLTGLPDLDLDLGFTPASNTAQLIRMALGVGDATDCPVLWLDHQDGSLTELAQTYRRVSETNYAYEAPSVPYRGILEVDPFTGFVLNYPGLWKAEPPCMVGRGRAQTKP